MFPRGTALFRSTPCEATARAVDQFLRGLYLFRDSNLPLRYQTRVAGVSSYTLKTATSFLKITPSNVALLLNILSNLRRLGTTEIRLRENVSLALEDAVQVVREVTGWGLSSIDKGRCRYSNKPLDRLVFCTEGEPPCAGADNSGLYASLLFGFIVCWLGFDGFYVPAGLYKRADADVEFHEELFLCNPRLKLSKTKPSGAAAPSKGRRSASATHVRLRG